MKTATAMPLWVLLLCAAVGAQDPRATNRPVEREIHPGASHSYPITLKAGDYVAGSIDQKGIAVYAAVFLPDGSRMRGLPAPREGKRDFAFIAETAGAYRLEVRGPTETEAAQNGVPARAQPPHAGCPPRQYGMTGSLSYRRSAAKHTTWVVDATAIAG